MVEFDNQIRAIFDGNRLADHLADNPRLTMGEAWLETEAGVIMLTGSGQLGLRHHGQQQEEVLLPAYEDSQSFGGDCVFHLCQHVADAWAGGRQAENTAREYLEIMKLVTVAYQSAAEGRKINLEM